MSKVKNPREKKRLAYDLDHYSRGGEHDKGWRKAKPLKKAKARRAYRKKSNDLVRVSINEETAPASATRKKNGLKQKKISVFGIRKLREYVESRLLRRKASVGAKQKRRARRQAT